MTAIEGIYNGAVHLLEPGLKLGEGRAALICGERSLSYGEFADEVARVAGALAGLGLQRGQRVVVAMPDGIEWTTAYLGAMWAGGVAVGVNPRLKPAELAAVLEDSEAPMVLADVTTADAVREAEALLESAPPRVIVAEPDWAAAARAVEPAAMTCGDMAFWIYSSGTTGKPKGVTHGHRAPAACDSFAREVLGLGPEDRFYSSSKLFFAYPLANSLFGGLRLGATVILSADWPTPALIAETVERHRPTVLFSVPALYRQMFEAGLPPRLAAAGVRHFVSAGEALPTRVAAGWREFGLGEIVNAYGATETLCLALWGRGAGAFPGPTPTTELRERGDWTPDRPGRLWLRHPALAVGYWRRPEAQLDAFGDGWFSPADLFLRDGAGYRFVGRCDDLVKISGRFVSPLEVEEVLLEACRDVVSELAALGTTDEDGSGMMAVFAVPLGNEALASRRIAAAAEESLPPFKRPRAIHLVEALPRTATGKLQRQRLKEIVA